MSATKNQDYESKATVDSALVDGFDPETFADLVQTEVSANLVMEELAMTVNRELVGSPGSSITIRQIGATTVNDKTEGTATAETDFSHNSTVVNTSPSAAQGFVKQSNIPLTDIAMEDSNLDEMERAAEDAGIRHAEARDQEHYDLVIGATQGGASPADGEAFSFDVTSAGEISYTDVKDAANSMRQDDYSVDSLVISYDHMSDLEGEDKFILANEAGTDDTLRDGLVGRFNGLEVYVTSQANASSTTTDEVQGVLLDSSRAYAVALKREPRVEEDRQEQAGSTNLVITQRFGNAIVDANGIGLLVNA